MWQVASVIVIAADVAVQLFFMSCPEARPYIQNHFYKLPAVSRVAGFSLTKRTRKSLTEEGGASPDHHHNLSAYDNPAFAGGQDALDVEEGKAKYSPKKNQSPGKKQSPTKDGNKKTWASLPSRDFPDGLHRQGSCGSLDNNYLHMGPEMESVWLQSQDIIGLGFNISGNMRDGIYVSQVHNRGPAIESGKIKVGDRIVSVTIAYDNIVYEDALTILSYASPYPVKVTLQKERTVSPENRSSSTEQLNHPLYRSQSLDALQRISKEPPFKPKRTQSEMKSETRRESPKKAADRKSKALSQTYSGSSSSARVDVTDDITVHAPIVESPVKGANNHHHQEVLVAQASQIVQSASPGIAEAHVELEDETTPSTGRKKSKLDTEAAREFASLMDQVLDDKRGDEDEVLVQQTAASVSVSPKTPPSKPQRKKKPSNSSLSSFDMPDAQEQDDGVEETISAVAASTAQALPRGFEPQGPEVEEEEIQPSFVKREVVIGNDMIQFEPKEHEERAEKRPPSPDTLAGFTMLDYTPPRQPEWEEVQEDVIEASVAALERLIAMNAFPPGTQGWAGIQRGGKQGGIHDDFLPTDVREALNGEHPNRSAHARSDSSSSSEASSRGRGRARAPRGGVAFEVRDDVMTGRPVAVEIKSRDSSASTSRSTSRDRMVRASSLRDAEHAQHHENKENRDEGLDWSGKRLVRAGSFSEIHQVDSVSDWTDKNVLNDDDDNSTTSGKRSTADLNAESDSEVEPPRVLPGRDIFKARENLANMSDLSNSISSSRSSSPAVTTNGPDVTSSGGLPALKSTSGGVDLAPTSDNNANSKTITFTLDGDADC
ncbi:hypothetical protein BaRGS_00026552 [Batillaria attramentaria]|uniref:PDZ domain-containing protein n=1 Tax=Batillaria attramentaria TaxID=370345 RepID=A0ABD0K5R6_9CAEN